MDTHTTKYWPCVIIITLFAFTAGIQAQSPVYDVFPLENGIHYTYEYIYQKDIWSISYPIPFILESTSRDSGISEYVITDSTSQDTMIAWSGLENRTIMHTVHYSSGVDDTTYPVVDSKVLVLREYTTRYHELRGTSVIWDFPATGGDLPVYRFSDSSNVLVNFESSGCTDFLISYHDSLWFLNDSGLKRRSLSFCTPMHVDGDYAAIRLSCHLISRVKVSVEDHDLLPAQTVLLPSYPNPANPTTTISYELATASDVVLTVYDILGRRIATIAQGTQQAGRHQYVYDGSNIGSGVYVVRLQSPGFTQTNKLIILK